MKGKEYFFETVRFLDEIVDISRALTAKYGMKEEYSKSYESRQNKTVEIRRAIFTKLYWHLVVPELKRLLTNIQSFIKGGFAYIDDSDFRHKVLQIPIDECSPIQTYGRVSAPL